MKRIAAKSQTRKRLVQKPKTVSAACWRCHHQREGETICDGKDRGWSVEDEGYDYADFMAIAGCEGLKD